ncbi:hypothetical protein RB195_026573 [Necator americanus]|uniref:Uncharacterized protein n=1 Tax=Necator americanus TaxID=51031 RepID=A0ABR1EXP4_NECAM
MDQTAQNRRPGQPRIYINDAERQRSHRLRETSQQRSIRWQANAEQQRRRRQNENEEQRLVRRSANAALQEIYILDTEMAAQQRLGNMRNSDCDPNLMLFLSEWFARNNVYAQSFKMMSEVEQMEIAAAQRENRQTIPIRMVFDDSRERGFARGEYAIPTANEVAVVYVGEENDVPARRSLAVHVRQAAGSKLMNISDIDKRCDLLTYPLLY